VFNNSANGTHYGELGFTLLKNAKEICESLGAKMLLGSEEDFLAKWREFETTYKGFSREHNIPYSPIIHTWRKCYPSDRPFKGDIGNNHGGYRLMAPYMQHLDLLQAIPIYESVKMFKVRPTYKSGSPVITDLVYDNNLQRLQYFTAISCGANDAIGGINGMDNLDNHNYDVSGATDSGITFSETSRMCRLHQIEFNKFGLIEFILSRVNVTSFNFSVECSVEPTDLYIAKTANSSKTYTDSPRTTFESVEFTYDITTKILTAAISSNSNDIQLYDKIRLIVACSGTFYLTNPTVSNYNGTEKVFDQTLHYHYRKIGTELMSKTSVETGWTLSGNAEVKSLPSAVANYTSYNNVASHIQLNSENDSASITIQVPVGTTKVALRIVAQMFTKYASTRWNGTELENGEYTANTPQYVNYDYDYGKIKVVVNDLVIRDVLLYQGWCEQYLEIDIEPTDTTLKLEIIKTSFVDNSYSNADKPIFIHNVSIQNIS